jgi:Cu/Ag efflux protein CusF
MRLFLTFILTVSVLSAAACSRDSKPATPYETFATYTKAINKKDTTTMKLLLSSESIKMHEQEAKAQGLTVDDVVKRETLFREGQRKLEFRNEKIDGDAATLEVKTGDDRWETVPFVREDGEWKIDKKGYRDRMMQEIEQENQQAEEQFNRDRIQP